MSAPQTPDAPAPEGVERVRQGGAARSPSAVAQ